MSSDFTFDEKKVITIRTNSFGAIRTFMGANATEKIDIMYGELTKILPSEKAIKKTEIRNVTTTAEIPDEARNTDYNKIFVEFTTEERAAQVIHEFWNPDRTESAMDFAKTICNFDPLIDERQYQGSLETGRNTEADREESSNELEESGEEEEQLNVQKSRKKKKRRSKSLYHTWQELTITESVINNINKCKTIEEHTRKNIYEIVNFAIENKKDETWYLLGKWLLENMQYTGKRTIILIHTERTIGFDWNAYDGLIMPLWQRQWEDVLGLRGNGIYGEIENTETVQNAILAINTIIREIKNRVDINISEKAFYIADMITNTISTILYNKYLKIMNNDDLSPEKIKNEDLNQRNHEQDVQVLRGRWNSEEEIAEISGMNKINVPGVYRVDFDPDIPTALKLVFCRGFELAKSNMLCLTSDPNENLVRGILKTSLTEVIGASGEIVYMEEPTEVEEQIYKIGYTIGKIAITRDIKYSIYVYNKNRPGHPKGPEYAVYPDTIYIKELKRSVNIDVSDPIDIDDKDNEEAEYSSISEGVDDISDTFTISNDENDTHDTSNETDESEGEELTLWEIADRMNIGGEVFQLGDTEDTSPEIDLEETCVLGFFICESCEKKFGSRMALGIHQKDCEEWERDLALYAAKNIVEEKGTKSKEPYAIGMDRLEMLGDRMREITEIQEECVNKCCKATEKYNELVECAKEILEEAVKITQEKNKSLYFKGLIIEQFQAIKKKDDSEIVLHRQRLVTCLDMMCKMERILKKYDIRFINNVTQKKARKNRIKSLIEGNEANERYPQCERCGRSFEEGIACEMHSGLLVCNQDMITNLNTKKHLSSKKNTWQHNAGERLTHILNDIDLSIKKSYLE